MALSATFTANFSSFYDAVSKAESHLKDFGDRADKVGPRLNALANQFSGVKVVQEATIMAKAIEDIGGVSKLTEKELARVGSTAQEAVAKMKALGMEVPKNIQAIADKTKDAHGATSDWLGTITKMASAVGIAFSVATITNFISSVFAAASAVKDLSDQWGVSTQAVQQWSAAAKAGGVAAETVGKSIQFMSEKLTEGSKDYDALLTNIGLSGDKLRSLSTEDAFREVLKALSTVEDGAQRLDLAIGLIGPSGRKMAGLLGDGFVDAAAKQKFMSDETVKRLAEAEAKWKSYYANLTIWGADFMAAFLKNADTLTSSWGNFLKWAELTYKDFVNFTRGNPTTLGPDFLKAAQAATAAAKGVDQLTASLKPVASHGAATNAALKTTAQVLGDVKGKEEGLTRATADRARASDEAKRTQELYTKSVADYDKSLNDLVNTFTGGGIIAKANLYLEALKQSIPIQQMTRQEQDNINKVMNEAIGVYAAAGVAIPKDLQAIADATRNVPEFKIPELPKVNAKDTGRILQWPGGVQLQAPKAPDTKGFDTFEKSVTEVAKAFANLGAISDGVMGDIAGGIATVIGAMNVAEKSADGFRSGLSNIKAGNMTAGLGQMATGAMGVVGAFQAATTGTSKLSSTLNGAAIGFSVAGPWGAAVGAVAGFVKGLWNARKEAKEVAKTRDDFLTAAGGVTELRLAAEDAGVSLDALFAANKSEALKTAITDIQKALESEAMRDAFVEASGGLGLLQTAAVNAGIKLDALFAAKSTDEVKAAIADVQAALEFQESAMNDLAEATERYGFTIEELGPSMQHQKLEKQAQGLYKDWQLLNSAGIQTVDITKRMSKAVSDYVNDAKRMGHEVPAEMRPMLEAFVKSGDLLDENGKAITDLEDSGIDFAMTMSEGFQALIKEVEKLTDTISRSLGLAIANVPDVEVKGTVKWEVPKVPKVEGPTVEVPQLNQGTGGFRNFGKGTLAMLHGWEAVVPRDEAHGALATVTGSGGGTAAAMAPTVIINAQGAFFDTPGDLQRLANKVGDALTAKYSVMGKLRAAV